MKEPVKSKYPKDFIPADAKCIIGIDESKDGDCTVKGFFDPKENKVYIQEIIYRKEGEDV